MENNNQIPLYYLDSAFENSENSAIAGSIQPYQSIFQKDSYYPPDSFTPIDQTSFQMSADIQAAIPIPTAVDFQTIPAAQAAAVAQTIPSYQAGASAPEPRIISLDPYNMQMHKNDSCLNCVAEKYLFLNTDDNLYFRGMSKKLVFCLPEGFQANCTKGFAANCTRGFAANCTKDFAANRTKGFTTQSQKGFHEEMDIKIRCILDNHYNISENNYTVKITCNNECIYAGCLEAEHMICEDGSKIRNAFRPGRYPKFHNWRTMEIKVVNLQKENVLTVTNTSNTGLNAFFALDFVSLS